MAGFVRRLGDAWARTGRDLGCRCSRSQLWLPALLLPAGARIGGGGGELMPVGGPARPRCLLTVSGSGQAAACGPAGIAPGTGFSQFAPALASPSSPPGYAAANTTLGSETPEERAAGPPAPSPSPCVSPTPSPPAKLLFLPLSPSASLVPCTGWGDPCWEPMDWGCWLDWRRLKGETHRVLGHCWGWGWGDAG